jgi:hypothetical protein
LNTVADRFFGKLFKSRDFKRNRIDKPKAKQPNADKVIDE